MGYRIFLSILLVISSCLEQKTKNRHVIRNFDDDKSKISVEYYISDSLLNGIYKQYFPSGKIRLEAFMKDGIGNGVEYRENGSIRFLGKYKQDNHLGFVLPVPHGLRTEYYPNGKINFISYFKNGTLDGISANYDTNGNLYSTGFYKDGDVDSLWCYFDVKKNIKLIEINKNGSLVLKKYY